MKKTLRKMRAKTDSGDDKSSPLLL